MARQALALVGLAAVAALVIAAWTPSASDTADDAPSRPETRGDADVADPTPVDREFGDAHLIKPAAPERAPFAGNLPPLFLCERAPSDTDTDSNSDSDTGAEVDSEADSRAGDDASPVVLSPPGAGSDADADATGERGPRVEVHRDRVVVRGHTLDRIRWVWRLRAAGADGARARVQGVRMTLGADGHPLLWEVADSVAGHLDIYVPESLVTAWRDSVREEGDDTIDAKIVSARAREGGARWRRTLSDGPVPMGPWVYITRELRVSTLLCRCMSSQMTGALSQETYEASQRAAATEDASAGAGGEDTDPFARWDDLLRPEELLDWPPELP